VAIKESIKQSSRLLIVMFCNALARAYIRNGNYINAKNSLNILYAIMQAEAPTIFVKLK
jgi:hypothetical protein